LPQRPGASIMQEQGTHPQSPQRSCAHQLTGRRALGDAVPGPDVVQQEVGERARDDGFGAADAASPARQHRQVTAGAADLDKRLLTAMDRRRDPSAWWWSQEPDEVRERRDAGAIV